MKRIISKIAIFIALLSISLTSVAYDFEVDGIQYVILSDSTVEIDSFKEYTHFGTELRIPEDVTFDGKTYEVVSFGSLVNITTTNVYQIFIPKTILRIGSYPERSDVASVWGSCTKLTDIYVDSENPVFASVDGVLFNKNLTSLLCYPVGRSSTFYLIPDGVEEIYYSAFRYSHLETIEMPNTLKYIRDCGFKECRRLRKVLHWSNSLESIEEDAFYTTSLSEVKLPASLTSIYTYAFNVNKEIAMKVYCEGSTPVKMVDVDYYWGYPFNDETIANGVLYVPRGSLKNYQRADGWNRFVHIEEYDVPYPGEDDDSAATLTVFDAESHALGLYYPLNTQATIKIEPTTGWEIHSVTFNGKDVTNLINGNIFVTDPLKGSNTLDIKMVSYIGSEVDNMNSRRHIDVVNNSGYICVSGLDDNECIKIYSLDGSLIYIGTDNRIMAPASGVYILETTRERIKFCL